METALVTGALMTGVTDCQHACLMTVVLSGCVTSLARSGNQT